MVTWNLWWRLGDWETRAEAIAHTLEELRPDLVCLQEVWQEGDRNQAALLAERLGLQHAFAPDRTEGGVDQGVALLSRWPLTEIECRALPVPPGVEQPNVALRAVVQGPRVPLLLATTHLIPYPHRSSCRELQLRALVEFLAERRPELLAADLKVAAVLLRTGLREGWIDANEFFRVTHRIWMALFFCGSPQAEQGWLEYRLRTSGDPSAFGEAIRSPELAAALLGWALAAAPDVSSPESARFHLAAALAVARLPWLWDAGDESAVGRELEVLLAHTGTSDGRNDVARIRAAWERMLRRGHALLRLEEAVRNITMRELRSRIRCADLHAGKLLWQGAAGYCVVTKRTPRVEGKKVPVLRLQGSPEESHFAAPFTVPILALLDEAVIPASPGFGEEPRRELREFLGELEKGLDQLVANAGERVIVKEERPRDT